MGTLRRHVERERNEPDRGRSGPAGSASSPPPASPSSATDVCVRDIDAGEDRGARAGRDRRSTSPAWPSCSQRNRERLHFTTDMASCSTHARLLFVCVGHAADLLGRRRPLARAARWSRRCRPPTRPRAGDEVHRAGRHRPTIKRRREHARALAYVSCPEFLKEGSAVEDFLHPDRVVVGADPATGPATPSPASTRRSAAPIVRTDVASAEMIKLASNAFLATKISLHQRDRQRLRGGRRRRHRGRARAWVSTTASARRSCRPGSASAARCFPKDVTALKQLAGNSGYHFQLLNSVIEVNELQKRRVIGKLEKHLGSLVGQAGRPARPGLQAQHRRHARGVEPRARGAAAGRGRRRSSPTTRSPRSRRASCCPASSCAERAMEALDGADAAVLVTEWPEFAELDWAAVAQTMAAARADRRPQLPRPRGGAGRRLHLRGDRAPDAATLSPRGPDGADA